MYIQPSWHPAQVVSDSLWFQLCLPELLLSLVEVLNQTTSIEHNVKVTDADNLPFSECYVWDKLWFTETCQVKWYQPQSLSRWSIGYHHICIFPADIMISFVSFLCVTLSEWNWHVMVSKSQICTLLRHGDYFVAIYRPTLFVGEFTHGLYALPSMVDANRTAIAVSS